MASLSPLKIILAEPRGFCAGVDRAIKIVEQALKLYGPPVYARHEIVHNRFVVESLANKGAIFVEELDQVPTGCPVIFSAHGVGKSVLKEAKEKNMISIDATCPLVTKIHREVNKRSEQGYLTLLIGHANHPEVEGTLGQVPQGNIILVEKLQDIEALDISQNQPLAYATQTTLSVRETKDMIEALKRRFPHIVGPYKEDICYATTNRQKAIEKISKMADGIIIVGAPNSSNSLRLTEIAKEAGCQKTILCERAFKDLSFSWFKGMKIVGLSAGASAPEELVQEVIDFCRQYFNLTLETFTLIKETITFQLPKELR